MIRDYLLPFLIGACAAFVIDFGLIRLINAFEGSRPETTDEVRRSFTIADKYLLPLAAGFEGIMITHSGSLAPHMRLIAGCSSIGLLYGCYSQWQNLRHDPEFGRKIAQWYHALIAAPLMVVVVAFPLLAPVLGLSPWWAAMGASCGVIGWAWCVIDDLRHGRIY